MDLFLKRVLTGPAGTPGLFTIDGIHPTGVVSLEPPWLGNRRDNPATAENESSCVRPGPYKIKVITHEKFGKVLRLEDKYERAGVLAHPGWRLSHTHGCILTGFRWYRVIDEITLGSKLESARARDALISLVEHEKIKRLVIIQITEKVPTL